MVSCSFDSFIIRTPFRCVFQVYNLNKKYCRESLHALKSLRLCRSYLQEYLNHEGKIHWGLNVRESVVHTDEIYCCPIKHIGLDIVIKLLLYVSFGPDYVSSLPLPPNIWLCKDKTTIVSWQFQVGSLILWIILESSFLSLFAFHFRHLITWQASLFFLFFFDDVKQIRAVCSQFSHEKKEVMKHTGTSMNSIITFTRRAEFLKLCSLT